MRYAGSICFGQITAEIANVFFLKALRLAFVFTFFGVMGASAEPPAENLLGRTWHAPRGVDVGCVDEVDPGRRRSVEDRVRHLLVALGTERHRAETDTCHPQITVTQLEELHAATVTTESLRNVPRDSKS